jgi:hypothetical protein
MRQLILTRQESDRFDTLEKIVSKGKKTFVEVGLALAEIRDKRLYRVMFKTFEEYCQQKWGWKASRARQLISAAEVQKSVTNVTLSNEGQARELAKVPEEERVEVIEKAAAKAKEESRPMTAKDIKESRSEPEPVIEVEEVKPVSKTINEDAVIEDIMAQAEILSKKSMIRLARMLLKRAKQNKRS